jgi:hypothetical protein
MFLYVVCCDCWRFDTISGYFGVCHFLSFSFLWCFRAFVLLSWCICNINICSCSGRRKSCAYGLLVDFAAFIDSGCDSPHIDMSLVVSLVECIVQWYVICHISCILFCVRSTLWCGSTLSISCIVVYYFAFGEVAQFGLSYFVDILCGIFHCCWLLVRYLRRRVERGCQWPWVWCSIGF